MAIINLTYCKWQKSLNQISSVWNKGFPASVHVFSQTSGSFREYRPVDFSDPRFDQDQWDGEQQIYRTTEPTKQAEYLVLYHDN